MKTVAILTILTIIPYAGTILGLIALILLFQCLTDISLANAKLGNGILENYRSKYSTALIIRLIGAILSIAQWFFPINVLNILSLSFNPLTIALGLVGFILMIIGAAIEMGAWQSFIDYVEQSPNVFPAYLKGDIIEGGKNLKNAALMNILFFLIVTILIGFIFQIIGYFKLAKLEQMMYSEPSTAAKVPSPVSEPSISSMPSAAASKTNFCPNCGAPIKGAGKFCGECGSPLN